MSDSDANRTSGNAEHAALLIDVRAAVAGRYLVDSPLGAGAMGVVFRAREVESGREIALKVMRPVLGFDDGVVARFHLEGQTMSQLDHQHIVRVHGCGESGHILWFAMELIRGGPLSQVIEAGPIPWQQAALLLAQGAEALNYAHLRGVIHRDIKPANLLLSERGDRLQVTDFGIARIVGARRLTATGTRLGTPSYMSPEQLFLEADAVAATDQYSLGVVGCRMLAGDAPPMAHPSQWKARRRHAAWRTSLRSLPCPPALTRLITGMVQSRPENRWPSLEVVGRAAREIVATGDAPSLRTIRDGVLAAALKRLFP
ncbi:MAG TPA: serine/threonine-protein kinase [Gemmatimonadales bacterium]|jgi:serine/threonine-protein kinase